MTAATLPIPFGTQNAKSSGSALRVGASLTSTAPVVVTGFSTVIINVPQSEAWLWENPALLAEVTRGLEEARAGKVTFQSFAEFVNDDDD